MLVLSCCLAAWVRKGYSAERPVIIRGSPGGPGTRKPAHNMAHGVSTFGAGVASNWHADSSCLTS